MGGDVDRSSLGARGGGKIADCRRSMLLPRNRPSEDRSPVRAPHTSDMLPFALTLAAGADKEPAIHRGVADRPARTSFMRDRVIMRLLLLAAGPHLPGKRPTNGRAQV